jgi:hypothetical protein
MIRAVPLQSMTRLVLAQRNAVGEGMKPPFESLPSIDENANPEIKH